MHTYAARALCWALACLFSSTVGAQKPGLQEAPVVRYAPGQPMPDRYIVTLAKGVADVPAEADAVMRGRGGRIHQHFKNSFKGFAATIPASELDSVRNNPKVLAVERDQILRLNEAGSPEQQTTWGTEPIAPQSKAADRNFARQPGTGVGSVAPRTSIAPKVPASAPVPSAQKLSTLEAKSAPQEIASFRFPAPKPIADRYIVTLSKDVVDTQAESESLMRGRGGRVHQHFKHGFRGFTATIPASELDRLRRLPHVLAVEPDQMVQINQAVSVVPQATWSLDRIDQVDRPLDSQYSFKNTGAGVTAFIVDTGIRADHSEFGGRVLPGFSVVTDGNGTSDCNGHGTHVAGVVGGRIWGVAKEVKLVPVRVMDCAGSGSVSGVIAGLDWAANTGIRPAVVNLSLGGGISVALNAAVAAAVAKGLVVVVAAGNSGTDACFASPANEPTAITVGATNSADAKASFSNYGACVDIFAPGASITSAWHTSTSASATMSGTSMASPAVAGVAALALQTNPAAAPEAVAKFLIDKASANKLSGLDSGSPNKLVFSMADGVPGVIPTKTVAVASMRYSTQSPARPIGLWYATIQVAVRDVSTGAPVANAQVAINQLPGGKATCTTNASGTCTVTNFFDTAASITVEGISGGYMVYDAAQNLAVQLRLPPPPFATYSIPTAIKG